MSGISIEMMANFSAGLDHTLFVRGYYLVRVGVGMIASRLNSKLKIVSIAIALLHYIIAPNIITDSY
ncbi:hypothetical protein [Calothrix sp. UHCC 0171]|uniref:hypothetical protein n=1 Tax=Calothrix sp. UHCC 0171 TaxID=3110245 RepID=UPI002B1FCF5C|nr:hypothetical protein [Calothrix sp. UHCC 0171]MEA5572168.1 hypothetical protein [Calothrix sp. UHCC 0171]